MKQKFIRVFLLISTLIPILSISQTTTFDYLSNNLGTNCNIFNPSVNISSVAHASLAGGVSYSSTYGLQLSTVPSGQTAGRTAFTINYSGGISVTATNSCGTTKDGQILLQEM